MDDACVQVWSGQMLEALAHLGSNGDLLLLGLKRCMVLLCKRLSLLCVLLESGLEVASFLDGRPVNPATCRTLGRPGWSIQSVLVKKHGPTLVALQVP
jgi:hypothetical protein